MAVVPKLEALNYYGASQARAASGSDAAVGTVVGPWFKDQTGGDYNDLGVSGILPDNRSGRITGILYNVNGVLSATGATAAQDARYIHSHIRSLMLEVFVNNVLVVRGPVQVFTHPPTWVQGTGPGNTESILSAQNSGYLMAFSPQDVEPRASIQVRGLHRHAVSPAAVTAHVLDIWLQVLDRKLV